MGAAGGPAEVGEGRDGVGEVGSGGHGDRDGGEGFAGAQDLGPGRVGVGGSGEAEVAAAEVFAEFPAPGAVVLDLPGEGESLVFETGDREVAAGGPGAVGGDRQVAAGIVGAAGEFGGELREVDAAQGVSRPAAFAEPVARALDALPAREAVVRSGAGEAHGPGGDGAQDDGASGADFDAGADGGIGEVEEFEGDSRFDAFGRLADGQRPAVFVAGFGVRDIAKEHAQFGVDETVRGRSAAVVGGGDLDQRQRVDREAVRAAPDADDAHRRTGVPLESKPESVTAPRQLFAHDAPCLILRNAAGRRPPGSDFRSNPSADLKSISSCVLKSLSNIGTVDLRPEAVTPAGFQEAGSQ